MGKVGKTGKVARPARAPEVKTLNKANVKVAKPEVSVAEVQRDGQKFVKRFMSGLTNVAAKGVNHVSRYTWTPEKEEALATIVKEILSKNNFFRDEKTGELLTLAIEQTSKAMCEAIEGRSDLTNLFCEKVDGVVRAQSRKKSGDEEINV